LSAREQAGVLEHYRLAYPSEAPVNWCPGLGTVLSNEEVTNEGRSERGNFPVFRRNLRQWMMRITAYADRLADDLDRVEWPEKVKIMQRNWIGRSEGAMVTFPVTTAAGEAAGIEVFTTRPDTLFGATFMVLAPEHPLVDEIIPSAGWPEGTHEVWKGADAAAADSPAAAVAAYRRSTSRKSDVERQMDDRTKTGVFTGAFAANPLNGNPIPVFVADYVLMGYGTGAIMAVPAGDQRDYDYATEFELPIVDVIAPVGVSDWPARSPWGTRSPRPGSPSTRPTMTCPRRAGDGRGEGEDHGIPAGQGNWPRDGQLPPARLAVQPAALLGRAVPGGVGRGRGRALVARLDAAVDAARCPGLLAEDLRRGRLGQRARAAAVPRERVGQRRVGPGRWARGAAVPPRDQHDAQLGRILLVLPALPRPDQLRGTGRPGQ
jgi:hypothetical protein